METGEETNDSYVFFLDTECMEPRQHCLTLKIEAVKCIHVLNFFMSKNDHLVITFGWLLAVLVEKLY